MSHITDHVKGVPFSSSSKREAIDHAVSQRALGHEAKVFRHEQNITQAARGTFASQIGGNRVSKAVHYTVEVKHAGGGGHGGNPNHDEHGRFT